MKPIYDSCATSYLCLEECCTTVGPLLGNAEVHVGTLLLRHATNALPLLDHLMLQQAERKGGREGRREREREEGEGEREEGGEGRREEEREEGKEGGGEGEGEGERKGS